jgi:hypothetical protein
LLLVFAVLGGGSGRAWAEPAVPAHLPGELSAAEILDGRTPFPPSPKVSVPDRSEGLATSRLTKVPPPGVHPRLLISPDDLPDLRRRLRETPTGRALARTLQNRLKAALENSKSWGGAFFARLAAGDRDGAAALVAEHGGLPPGIGHYQPFLTVLVFEALDALIADDAARGRQAATAVATYAELIRPAVEASGAVPLHDDVWRARVAEDNPVAKLGLRDAVGGHLLGYAYDFAWPFMTEAQRAETRKTIAVATSGRLWMGARLPRHFRNWNWIACGLQQPLLALAIEGEEGYDPRVYRLGVEIARDYLTYGISPSGTSTEAVGYTQFGLVWANPFFVVAQRRGENLLGHGHHRAMIDWYLQSGTPARDAWLSGGDGGDSGPALWTMAMWRYFYPQDPRVAALWRSVRQAGGEKMLDGSFHLVEALLWADDPPGNDQPVPANGADLAALGLPMVSFDPVRGLLIARNGWGREAAWMQFECRVDSVGASHEHADRGNFVFAALGRVWAKDNFRSVETRHHNGILIDGKGQGYWPGPGVWLDLEESGDLLRAACDAKPAYDWFWPKQIVTEDPAGFVRFAYPRWESYRKEAEAFRKQMQGLPGEKDDRPAVKAFWEGFGKTDPRLWDEDGWPVRYPHNPVQRAFRTIVFDRGPAPFLLVVDDIQKDNRERLYEWLMQTGPDTEVAAMTDDDITLCDASVARGADGRPKPKNGDRLLLVRVLRAGLPVEPRDYPTRPSPRLETFERRDTLLPPDDSGKLSGNRSFGLDKRLVIPSRSVAPGFVILLYPFRQGDTPPETRWNADRTELTVTTAGVSRIFQLATQPDGRTRITLPSPES